MAKMYIIKLSEKQLEYSTDMLRYEDCFSIEKSGDEWEIKTLRYTPERWSSFGVHPSTIEVASLNILQSEWNKYTQQATGFVRGVRFAQKLLGDKPDKYTLVQDF